MEKTIAQKALELIEPIPQDEFMVNRLTDYNGKCCVLGHFNRLTSDDPSDYYNSVRWSKNGGEKLRDASKLFIQRRYNVWADIAVINNVPEINGYTEPVIKDRVVHLLKDMIKAGY